MRWPRQTSYHGNREYAPEPPTALGGLAIRLRLLLKLILGRRKAVSARAESREPMVALRMRGPRGFTVLGLPGFDAGPPTSASWPIRDWDRDQAMSGSLAGKLPRRIPDNSFDFSGGN